MVDTDLPPVDKIRDLFDLPTEVHGWLRYESAEDDRTIFEYWRAQSNHVSGEYERIVAKPRPMAGEVSIGTEVFDQFGHRVNYRTHTSRKLEFVDRIWKSATRKMKAHPGKGEFENPPELPVVIGEWELICDKWDGTENIAVWEWGFGEATLKVTETDIECHYSYTRRPQRIEYIEPDSDPVVIVDDMSRRFAYEIATNTLENLPAPLSQLGNDLSGLQSLKGIGPAKSRKLALLGFRTPKDIAEYVSDESKPVNHHHRDEIDKVLTTQIRESVTQWVSERRESESAETPEEDEVKIKLTRGVV